MINLRLNFPTLLCTEEKPEEKHQVPLYDPVQKQSPEDNSTMKICGNLWGLSFNLRERGDWTKLEKLSEICFTKYKNDVDIQVLLYRIQMCIYTFYIIDMGRANTIYDKVTTMLRRAKYPNWHLALILALKVQICTKNKKFEEAKSLLEDAKQTMHVLSPCLSTGTVFLSEAMYLASLLKCNPRSSHAGSIRDQIKRAYLTAIDHYRKEKIFGVNPFLNQVYLFLSLFALGIDPVDSQFDDTNRCSEETAIEFAEHYLNLLRTLAGIMPHVGLKCTSS